MLAEIIWDADALRAVMGMSIPLVTLIGYYWMKVQRTRSQDDLKRSMVERGMSVEEIERVIAARPLKQ